MRIPIEKKPENFNKMKRVLCAKELKLDPRVGLAKCDNYLKNTIVQMVDVQTNPKDIIHGSQIKKLWRR